LALRIHDATNLELDHQQPHSTRSTFCKRATPIAPCPFLCPIATTLPSWATSLKTAGGSSWCDRSP
jgi:hypothetical protein